MFATKPSPIDFKKIKANIKSQLDEILNLINIIRQDILKLESRLDSLNSDELKTLSVYRLDLIDLNTAHESKRMVYDEYLLRCNEFELQHKVEIKDYTENYQKVWQKALTYRNDKRLPVDLGNHLKQIVKQKQQNFTHDQRVIYYLALKKEIDLCDNYIKNLK